MRVLYACVYAMDACMFGMDARVYFLHSCVSLMHCAVAAVLLRAPIAVQGRHLAGARARAGRGYAATQRGRVCVCA